MSPRYPRIDMIVDGKRNPGLQVVDMLLWSVYQQRYRPRKKQAQCANWCGLNLSYDARASNDRMRWLTYLLNTSDYFFLNQRSTTQTYSISSASEIESTRDTHELAELYCFAERVVRAYAKVELPDHASHLQVALRRIVRRLDARHHATPDDIQSVARAFLRLFDTLPLSYEAVDSTALRQLLKAKRFLGLALHDELMHGGRTTDFFATVRSDNIGRNPRAFGIE